MTVMPTLPNARTPWEMDRAHVVHLYTDFSSFSQTGSQILAQAEGVYVTDTDGRRLLDGIAGLWCVNIGHGQVEMAEAVSRQITDMQYYNPFGASSNIPAAELGAKLAELVPDPLNHVIFSCVGSTANEAAAGIAQYYHAMRGQPGKRKIIARLNGYHGATAMAAALTGIHVTKYGFAQVGEDFIHHVSAADMYARPVGMTEAAFCDFLVTEFENCILQLGAASVAAFIAEPIMGAGGVLVAPADYHKRMRAVCDEYGLLYIADEVVTVFGRLGAWFASSEIFDDQPDIIVTAKGITSGYIPLGATLLSDEKYDVISRLQCESGVFSMGLNYFNHPVACAAALKNIEIMERGNLLGSPATVGAHLQLAAKALSDLDIVGDVRGMGLTLGIDLVADRSTKAPLQGASEAIFKGCVERGVIVRPVGSRIILSPPLVIDKAECDTIITAIAAAAEDYMTRAIHG